jgi:2-polyprenyl-3-methyl-5-hydroxy-6-metoxy-1,4-benzoquinol methylase
VTEVPLIPERLLECLKDPVDRDGETPLRLVDGALKNDLTGRVYEHAKGIPSLFMDTQIEGVNGRVLSEVKDFYEENPFPSYEGLEEYGELVTKGSSNPFSRDLLRAIGHNKLVLECGCGTGQLTNFLQLNNNNVLGIDMSLGSLSLAIEHKLRNALPRSGFLQMNIFDLALKDEAFDVVISHGVLHHTPNARLAFKSIVRKLRPGGIIVVGFYNRTARIMTWLRSKLIPIFGSNVDFVVRERISDATKANIWIKDQYYNPNETWHSIDEILGYFAENNIEFINCAPPILDTSSETNSGLFDSSEPGTRFQREITQLFWLGSIAREGSLFDMIGRKASN